MNITDNYNDFINNTDNEKDDNHIVIKNFLLTIASSILLLCLVSLVIWSFLGIFFSQQLNKG